MATFGQLLALQLVPHAPQLVTLVAVLVSQPLAFMPSQLRKVLLHEAMPQVLDEQL